MTCGLYLCSVREVSDSREIRMIAYFNPNLLMQMLFHQQSCRQSLLHMRRHQYASFAMLRMGSTVDADTLSPGHSPQYRQQSFELRTHRHTHFIRQCRNQIIRIFHRITQRYQCFLKSLFSHFVQSPSQGSTIRRHSNQFVVTHVECVMCNYV